jgi:hypothetical protein
MALICTPTAEELRQWLLNPQEMAVKVNATRKPPMPSHAKLAKEDVESLIAYMLTLKKKDEIWIRNARRTWPSVRRAEARRLRLHV